MRSCLVLLICLMPLQMIADAPQTTQTSDIEALEKQIKDCKDQLAVAKMQAYIAGSDADQYLGEDWEDYQRAIAQQEQYEAQTQMLKSKLADLEKQLVQKKAQAK